MPGLDYVGNCEWEPSGNPEEDARPNEMPTVREPWIGRQDKTEDFRAEYPVGRAYLSGFIVANAPRDNQPFQGVASVDLMVARAPDFDAYLADNVEVTRTSSRSATVPGFLDKDGYHTGGGTEVTTDRSISYVAYGSRYRYFASERPAEARFAAPVQVRPPMVLKSVTKASGQNFEKTFVGSTSPAPIATALHMPQIAVVSDFQATPIPGTPWYECSCVVTIEFDGDA